MTRTTGIGWEKLWSVLLLGIIICISRVKIYKEGVRLRTKKKLDLKPIEINTPRANRWRKLIRLAKLPIIKQLYKRIAYPDGFETQTGTPIPVNVSLGTYRIKYYRLKSQNTSLKKQGLYL